MATGFFGHHLTYGGSVLITACLTLGLVTAAPTWSRRRLLGAALGLQVGGVVVSLARTAWAGLVAAAFGLIPALRATHRRWGILALGTVILFAFLAPPVRQRIGPLRLVTDDPRVRLWQTALIIWGEYPVLGAGLGTYEILFPKYKVPGRYDATGNPHNESLGVLVSSGLIGFAAFVFLWFRFFGASIGGYRRTPRSDPRRALLLGGILSAVGLLAGGMGQCFLYDEEVATLFWLTAAGTMVTVLEVPAGSGER
jgi:O-antigen ligase